MHRIALALLLALASCASSDWVIYDVDSSPQGGLVEVNGIHLGTTPCQIKLRTSERWVGLANAPGGWAQGGETYLVIVYPPVNSSEPLYSQSKQVMPAMTPDGGMLFFNLRLVNVAPVQPVEFRGREP
jgi:hypothetical protein